MVHPFKQETSLYARASGRTPDVKPGGGVIFGPKPKDWSIKMNKKERRLAMATAIQSAAPAMVVVDDLSAKLWSPKTKVRAPQPSAGRVRGRDAERVTKDASDNVTLSTRNMAKVVQSDIKHLNVYDVLNADKVVLEDLRHAYIRGRQLRRGGAAWA